MATISIKWSEISCESFLFSPITCLIQVFRAMICVLFSTITVHGNPFIPNKKQFIELTISNKKQFIQLTSINCHSPQRGLFLSPKKLFEIFKNYFVFPLSSKFCPLTFASLVQAKQAKISTKYFC